jgi:hypothetical protein
MTTIKQSNQITNPSQRIKIGRTTILNNRIIATKRWNNNTIKVVRMSRLCISIKRKNMRRARIRNSLIDRYIIRSMISTMEKKMITNQVNHKKINNNIKSKISSSSIKLSLSKSIKKSTIQKVRKKNKSKWNQLTKHRLLEYWGEMIQFRNNCSKSLNLIQMFKNLNLNKRSQWILKHQNLFPNRKKTLLQSNLMLSHQSSNQYSNHKAVDWK